MHLILISLFTFTVFTTMAAPLKSQWTNQEIQKEKQREIEWKNNKIGCYQKLMKPWTPMEVKIILFFAGDGNTFIKTLFFQNKLSVLEKTFLMVKFILNCNKMVKNIKSAKDKLIFKKLMMKMSL